MKMKLLIVIVNYRSADLTIDCLRSLQPELTAIPDAHVVVTDNLSPDDSVAKLNAAVIDHHWENRLTIAPLPKNGRVRLRERRRDRAGSQTNGG